MIKKETAHALKVSQFAEREAADNRRSSEVSEEYEGFMFRNLEFLLTMFDLQILMRLSYIKSFTPLRRTGWKFLLTILFTI